ncbi:MAG: DUF1049 domain-containing protein [Alphaproteobacteria bacterium]|nr:DUF1049 domain-containing protein [Alphaproteobacteria bacterium]
MTSILRWAAWLIVAAAAVIFAVNNRGFVTLSIDPFPYTLSAPLYLIALMMFAAGIIIGGSAQIARRLRARSALAAAQARIKALENELTGLRLERQPLLSSAVPEL